MPISLRLPVEVEKQIAGYSARHGVSKSAVIVRSIAEFLTNHAQPSSFQIYEEAMREAQVESSAGKSDSKREAAGRRPRKIKVREAIRGKHALRSKRATQTLSEPPDKARNST